MRQDLSLSLYLLLKNDQISKQNWKSSVETLSLAESHDFLTVFCGTPHAHALPSQITWDILTHLENNGTDFSWRGGLSGKSSSFGLHE